MRLTRAGEYAVRCILYMCDKGKGTLVSRQEIASHTDIPPHFLAKIAQQLAKAGLIEIRQGARGGFVLSRQPSEITLLHIVETMIGEIYLNDCVLRPESCNSQKNCAVHKVWIAARDQLRATLSKTTLQDLMHHELCTPLRMDQIPLAEETVK